MVPARASFSTMIETPPLSKERTRSVIAESTAHHWADWFAEHTGLVWTCVDVHTGEVLARSALGAVPYCSHEMQNRLPHGASPIFHSSDDSLVEVALPLPGVVGNGLALTSYFLTHPQARPLTLVQAAALAEWTNAEFDAFLKTAPTMSLPVGQRLISGLLERLRLESREAALEYEIGALSQQLEYTTDETTLLHGVTEHLNLVRSVRELAEICVHRIHGLIDAAGHIVVITDEHQETHLLIDGEVPFDSVGVQMLLRCLDTHVGSRTIFRNELASTLFGENFPGLESLVVAAIGERGRRSGWIISCNLRYGHYGPIEANLLNTVARLLSTHSRNQRLFHEQDELLIDFVRSLVSTLDAKDPYTRGHSERVALVARRLSEELGLTDEEKNDIYLASLLHDIGKVGIDDRILRKPEQLTQDEFEQVQRHPDIGYQILKPLKHLQQILPGVRSHHETVNGRGYPQQLRGNAIPLMARIIAVADGYDAMSSDRPYRRGMPLDKVEEIFRRGIGEQWDRTVIEAYFAARDDIRALCDSYTLQDGNLLDGALSACWTGIGNRAGRSEHHGSADEGCSILEESDDSSLISVSSIFITVPSHHPQTT
ncbi:MAG: HD-GYP domain-containing protein [Planctomycetaceae bacterium]|nr:HD-GYP domain-containing protein [Planctomycetaceae bacterium]